MSKLQGTLEWAIFRENGEPIFMNSYVYGICCNDTILFINIKTHEEKLYCANGGEFGDGISYLAGNKLYSLFAFAENKFNPRIFIKSYPDYTTLGILSGESVGEYVGIRFNDGDHLVTLTGYPHFKINVWNFRLGELLANEDTNFLTRDQEIKCNMTPFLCAQYAPNLGLLTIWEIHIIIDNAYLIRRSQTIPFINRNSRMSFVFGIDGNLYIVDKIGNFYTLQPSIGTPKQQWAWNGCTGHNNAHLTSYRGGFIILGSNGQMKHIKKISNNWTVMWDLKSEYSISWTKGVHNFEVLYCLCRDSSLLQLDDNSDQRKLIKIGNFASSVKFFGIIRPYNKNIVMLTRLNDIHLVAITNKKLISNIKMTNIILFKCHSHLPIVCMATTANRIYLLSYFIPEQPEFLTDFQLNDIKIVDFKLTQTYLIVQNENFEFFIINNNIGSQIEVLHKIQCQYIVLQFEVLETSNKKIDIIILIRNNKTNVYSDEILFITLINSEIKEMLYKLPDKYISISIFKENHILASLLNANVCHNLKYTDNKISIHSIIKTPHQLDILKAVIRKDYFLTWSFDGIVCIFKTDKEVLDKVIMANNRRNCNDVTKKVLCTFRYCLILSRKGILKCFNINKNAIEYNEAIPDINGFFKSKTLSPVNNPDLSWEQLKHEDQLNSEIEKFAAIRVVVVDRFNILQEKLKLLIDENENLENEDDRLPMNSFNLARDWSNIVIAKAKKNRENEDKTLRSYIEDQNRIQKWIIQHTWQEMMNNCSKINGIFSNIMCENYSLIKEDLNNSNNQLNQISLWREKEMELAGSMVWFPWFSMQATQHYLIALNFNILPTASAYSFQSENENEGTIDNLSISKYALSGTGTYKFVEPHPARYQQLEVVSYNQLFLENTLAKIDINNLKIFFNKEYEEMKKFKVDQVGYVRSRNARLREIQSEMNILAKLKDSDKIYNDMIEDPTFLPQEKPETIIKVDDSEVSVKPYISPSRQKILDEIAYQAELRRLALLADDFRERALIAMMDGVLEKRWEDEIKKTPPKPEVMLKNKDPGEYTKEDIKAYADYEEKVKFINSERDRYQVMLEEEETKIQQLLDDQILRFNRKCGELFFRKLTVDAAVKHEEIKLLRMTLYNTERINLKKNEENIRQAAVDKKNDILELNKVIETIEKRVQDCRTKYEQLQYRDRQLDKQFKIQFSESAPTYIVDQAYKYFKKHPKLPQRAWATAVVLMEMAIRVIQKNTARTGFPLPEECFEFLTTVDNIDNYSVAPNTIDQKLWDVLCRLRRQKMESEFKLKACGVQLAEAEVSLNNFIRELSYKKLQHSGTDKEIQAISQKAYNLAKNRSVQIVMPMGLVEVPLTGHISDFQGCLLLSCTDVGEINDIIKTAGMKKLKAMEKVAVFRRKVIFKEWEHKVLQMSVEDLKELVTVIEHAKVTIEMRQWLKEKSEGRVLEITNATLTRDMEAKMRYIESQLTQIDLKIDGVQKQIIDQREDNKKMDKNIMSINVDVTEQNLLRDLVLEEKELQEQKERMQMVVDRAKLVRNIQKGHSQILELITLLELQRLKTFPTLTSQKKAICS